MSKVDAILTGIEAHFASDSVNRDVQAGLASYAKEILAELERSADRARAQLSEMMPGLPVKEFTGKDLLPDLILYLQGREYHDSDENK